MAGDGVKSADRARRGGTVLILVVGVLALLAVMGTAYLVMSRTERGSGRAVSQAVNLDLAERAVMAQTLEAMWTSNADEDGRPLAFALPWQAGRVYQVGDVVYDQPAQGNAWHVFRCNTLDTSGSQPGGNWTPAGPTGNPGEFRTARLWAYGEMGVGNQNAYGRTEPRAGVSGYANVSSQDLPWLFGVKNTRSLLSKAGFDPTGGGQSSATPAYYSIGWKGTPDVAVADPIGALDGEWMLLPFSGASAVRYRFALKIVDTSGRINLNTGNVDSSQTDPTGQYVTTVPIYPVSGAPTISLDGGSALMALHNGSGSGGGTAGRWPGGGQMNLATWQAVLWRWEQPGAPGGSITQFFDGTDELDLRTYVTRGTGYICRPAALLPGTLAPGRATRDYFTADSGDRDFMPYPAVSSLAAGATTSSLPYKVNTGSGLASYWPYPRKICVNTALTTPGSLTQASAMEIVKATVNLATLMRGAGFSESEARSFAANYLSYRLGGGSGNPYKLANGPTYIDNTGIHLRGSIVADIPSDLGKDTSNSTRMYVGFSAQPFVNEMVAAARSEGDRRRGNDRRVGLGGGVGQSVQLRDRRKRVEARDAGQHRGDGVNGEPDGERTGERVPGDYERRRNAERGDQRHGVAGAERPGAVAAAVAIAGAGDDQRGGGFIRLPDSHDLRGGGGMGSAAALSDADVRGGDESEHELRVPAEQPVRGQHRQLPVGVGDRDVQHERATNLACGAVIAGRQEHDGGAGGDRHAGRGTDRRGRDAVFQIVGPVGGATQPPAGTDGNYGFNNIADFNRIMRVTNIYDTTNASNTIPLSEALGQAASGAGDAQSDCPHDAMIHFDFKMKPLLPQNDNNIESKNARLLDGITFLNRTDPTYTHQEPCDPGNRYLTRIPGRININTADANVLQALMTLVGLTLSAGTTLVSYRDRTGNFTSSSAYPGYGFRSVGELLVPLTSTAFMATVPKTFDQRDQVWAMLFNELTVRSDTYVVYGLLQAVQQSGMPTSHNNTTDWYDASNLQQHVVAQRRFIALVDLSYCNYRRPMPWVQNMRYNVGDTAIGTDGNFYYVAAGTDESQQEASAGTNAPPAAPWTAGNTFTGPRIVAMRELPQ